MNESIVRDVRHIFIFIPVDVLLFEMCQNLMCPNVMMQREIKYVIMNLLKNKMKTEEKKTIHYQTVSDLHELIIAIL